MKRVVRCSDDLVYKFNVMYRGKEFEEEVSITAPSFMDAVYKLRNDENVEYFRETYKQTTWNWDHHSSEEA